MWIVRLALRRTYTFLVLAVLIAVVGALATQRMSTDIFPVVIPAAAVVIRDRAPAVGVLDASRAIRYRPVQLGRDYGATVEVAAGLQPGEVVAVHPGDDLPEGTVVEPVSQPAQ